MAQQASGTNLFDSGIANGGTVDHGLTNPAGDWVLVRCTVANIPSGASGYAVGCSLQATDTGNNYVNTGTSSSSTFTLLDAGTAFSLPIAATDSTTTTGTSAAFTMNAVTTGHGETISVNGLTTGTGESITHTTSVIANGGSLLRLSSTGVDTSTTTGVLLDLSSTASTAGTQVLETLSGLTTGIGHSIVTAAETSGTALKVTGGGANMTSSGQTVLVSMGAATTGQGLEVSSTGTYTGLNGILETTANGATTGTTVRMNGTGISSGNVLYAVGGGANLTTGGNIINADAGAATAGTAVLAQATGAYTGTDGILRATSVGTTTGIIARIVGAIATLTTGRYLSIFDGATEVFGVGTNGHLISTVSASLPSAAITTNQGISAAAITAGGSDTCGVITTTGTQNNVADSTFTVTFGKTYTTAPKAVILTPANAAAALAAQSGAYVSSVSATNFVVGVSKSSAAAATPSWNYFVIA